ncbi:SCO2523 family variant P-loop protein [Nocardia sp. CS682]|uniref:SCO2523 family variant P-loop protein n=1 Tax=Nocardia sp. CS682 TaxID=1047172 RepID=UPI001074B7B3|nr:SCO2523 family variant P-loop protein [Nocardia sp. CS682]QBS44660.1 hypothetical protein DMB37_35835 [Nocardia sp. CS682]
MIVFAISDKGGTGRSVTSANIGYRMCVMGKSVAYLDFDFGSPTAGALFEIDSVERGVAGGTGLHSYLTGNVGVPTRIDVRHKTDRRELQRMRMRTGKLALLPGDTGGAEFAKVDHDVVRRCAELLLTTEQDFDVCLVDVSAGRSVALEIAVQATGLPQFAAKTVRWLVFHRWTRQHIVAAADLVHGPHGVVESGAVAGHDPRMLLENIRFVRTAVPRLSEATEVSDVQAAWLHEQHAWLKRLAAEYRIGAGALLGETPIDPVLQWREQLILDIDVMQGIAKEDTVEAFASLANRVLSESIWQPMR